MLDNPYSKLIKIIREEGSENNPLSFLIGQIVNPLPNIIVKLEGIQIDKSDIWISDNLSNVKAGDNVLVLCSEDRQQFIIISKVVRP